MLSSSSCSLHFYVKRKTVLQWEGVRVNPEYTFGGRAFVIYNDFKDNWFLAANIPKAILKLHQTISKNKLLDQNYFQFNKKK